MSAFFGPTGKGGSGGGTAIGGTITGGLDKRVLFVHPNGTLAQSSNLQFDTVNNFVAIGDGTIFTDILGTPGKALVVGSSNSPAAIIVNVDDPLDNGSHFIWAQSGTGAWDLGQPDFDNGKLVLSNLAAGGVPVLSFDPNQSIAGVANFGVPIFNLFQNGANAVLGLGPDTPYWDATLGSSSAPLLFESAYNWHDDTNTEHQMAFFGSKAALDGDNPIALAFTHYTDGTTSTPMSGIVSSLVFQSYNPLYVRADGTTFVSNGGGTIIRPINNVEIGNGGGGGSGGGPLVVGDDYMGVATAPVNGALFQGHVGIGSTNPVAPMHVISGSDGGISAVGDETIIAQRNGSSGDNAIISLISGDNGIAQLRLGDTTLTYNGDISFDNNAQEMRLQVGNIPRITMQDSGSIIMADTVQCDFYGNTSNRSFNFGDLNAVGLGTTFFLDDNSGQITMASPGGNAEILISAGSDINLSTGDTSIDISEGSGLTFTDSGGAGINFYSGGASLTVNCDAQFQSGTWAGLIGLHGGIEDPSFSQGTAGQVATSTGAGSWHWAAGVTVDWNNPGTLGATTPNTVKATTVATTGKVITYNNVATAGGGIPVIRAQAQQPAQTTGQTICTFTPGATGTFIVSGFVNITAVTLDVIKLTVTYKDRNGTSQTLTPLSGLGAIGNNSFSTGEIQCNNTVITVATTLTTGTGSITYDDGATIMQLS